MKSLNHQDNNQITATVEKLKNINEPVYLTGETGHHFSEFIKAVDSVKDLSRHTILF